MRCAAAITTVVFHRLKQPVILGYLLEDIERSPMCGNARTDARHMIVTMFTNRGSKRVVDYAGCSGAPTELGTVEKIIDSTANVRRWLRRT